MDTYCNFFFVIGRKGNSKKIARETAKLIRDYFVLDEGEVEVPKEYEDISHYLSEIKKQNQDSERLMLEEVNKKNDLIAYLAHDLKNASYFCGWLFEFAGGGTGYAG